MKQSNGHLTEAPIDSLSQGERMIKFKTGYYAANITAVEVIRETEHFVVLMSKYRGKEIKEAKSGAGYNYHDSWEDAHKFLWDRAQDRLESAEKELDRCRTALALIKNMPNPSETNRTT